MIIRGTLSYIFSGEVEVVSCSYNAALFVVLSGIMISVLCTLIV